MSRLTKLILWLYIVPLLYIARLCDKLRGLVKRVGYAIITSAEYIPEPNYESFSNQYKRAWDLMFPDVGYDPPYNPAADAPVIRQAVLMISSTIGALVVLLVGLPLLVPVALDVAQHGLQFARACASGWLR